MKEFGSSGSYQASIHLFIYLIIIRHSLVIMVYRKSTHRIHWFNYPSLTLSVRLSLWLPVFLSFKLESVPLTLVRLTSQMFNSPDESLKDETRLLLLWNGLLGKLLVKILHLISRIFTIIRWILMFSKYTKCLTWSNNYKGIIYYLSLRDCSSCLKVSISVMSIILFVNS